MRHAHRELFEREPRMRRRQLITQIYAAGRSKAAPQTNPRGKAALSSARETATPANPANARAAMEARLTPATRPALLSSWLSLISISTAIRRPSRVAAWSRRSASETESSVSTEAKSSAARAALFDCKWPMRWNSRPGLSRLAVGQRQLRALLLKLLHPVFAK